jgi:hypothetical protein
VNNTANDEGNNGGETSIPTIEETDSRPRKTYFREILSAELLKCGITAPQLSEFQVKEHDFSLKNNYDGLAGILDEVRAGFPQFSPLALNELTEYIRLGKEHRVIRGPIEKKNAEYQTLMDGILEMINHDERRQLLTIPQELKWDDCKKLMRDLVGHLFLTKHEEIIPFIISTNFEANGNVTGRMYPTTKSLQLVAVAEKDDNVAILFPFVEKPDLRGMSNIQYLNASFWFSKFNGDDNQQYTLLSTEPLKMQRGKIEGMHITFRDVERIGSAAKIPTSIPIIIVTKQTEEICEIDEENARVITLPWEHDDVAKRLFGAYRHPVWFEKYLISWLLSGKVSDYPLNIGWFSEAGTGKSYVLDTMNRQFREKGIFSGGTIKGLVPNFGDSLPDEGYICKCERVAMVDEFFSILRRAKQSGEADAGTDLLTNILEHKKRPSQSGRGASSYIEVNPRAKTIFISNTRNFNGLENMVDISHSLNNPFLSRILWYCQTKQHIQFIDDARARVKNIVQDDPNRGFPEYEPEFVSLFDFFNSITLKLDYDRTAAIVKKYGEKIPEDLKEVYRRYDHHFECLVDGVAKYNYIVNKKEKLEVLEQDYEEAEEIFSTIIHSWFDTVDVSKMPTLKARVNFLNPEQRFVFDIIEKNPGIPKSEIKVPEAIHRINELERLQLIKAYDDNVNPLVKRYYVHWHMFVLGDASG